MHRSVVASVVIGLFARSVLAGPMISAEAFGELNPRAIPNPGTIVNGDFLVTQELGVAGEHLVGDGINDITSWSFDFTADPRFAGFPISAVLESALLTLTITPRDYWIRTDSVRVWPLPIIETPIIQGLTTLGVTTTVQLELLDFYTSDDIVAVLTTGAGLVPMRFIDDAAITYARLDLTPSPVPEPGTLALVAVGLGASILGLRRRRGSVQKRYG